MATPTATPIISKPTSKNGVTPAPAQTPPSAAKTLLIMFGTLAFPFALAAAVIHLRKR